MDQGDNAEKSPLPRSYLILALLFPFPSLSPSLVSFRTPPPFDERHVARIRGCYWICGHKARPSRTKRRYVMNWEKKIQEEFLQLE